MLINLFIAIVYTHMNIEHADYFIKIQEAFVDILLPVLHLLHAYHIYKKHYFKNELP